MSFFLRWPHVILFLACVLGVESTFAQQGSNDFGVVSIEDLKSKNCTFDSSASAVVLSEVVRVDMTKSYKYEYSIRIKFFKNVDFNEWANVHLRFNKTSIRLSKVRGATYNLEDGKVVTTVLDEESIFETKFTKKTKQMSFALPQVKAGSIIEYSYTLSSQTDPQFVNTFSSIFGFNVVSATWDFQHSIPVYRSDFYFRGGFASSFLQGIIPETQIKQEMDREHNLTHWFVNNVPAFSTESTSIPKSDLIGKIYVDLSEKSWAQLGKSFNKLQRFGLTARDSALVSQLAERFKLVANASTRADSVVRFVKRKIKWNGEIDLTPDTEFADLFVSGWGSSCEINLVMMALLKKAGLRSHPVLVSTRGNGRIAPIRPRAQFNDLVASVIIQDINAKDEVRLLDATDRYLSSDYIPLRHLTGYGLLVNGDKSSLITISTSKSKTSVSANLYLNETNQATGNLEISFSGLDASGQRHILDSLGAEKYGERIKAIYQHAHGEPSYSNAKVFDQPFKVFVELNSNDLFRAHNNLIYINPLDVSPLEGNLFKSDSRSYPIDLNPPHERTYLIKIVLPKNCTAEELPKSDAFSLPNNSARFAYNINQHDNIIFVTSYLVFNRVIYEPQEYQSLREFYRRVLNKQSENIVLRRIL